MKQTLEQRLRGGFSKLSITRQYINDWTGQDIGSGFFDSNGDDISNHGAYTDITNHNLNLQRKNMSSVNLSGGIQLHIHEGITGTPENYDLSSGQHSMAHFKQGDINIGHMSSYDSAMGHAYARQMGLGTSGFNSKSNGVPSKDEWIKMQEQQELEDKIDRSIREFDALASLIRNTTSPSELQSMREAYLDRLNND